MLPVGFTLARVLYPGPLGAVSPSDHHPFCRPGLRNRVFARVLYLSHGRIPGEPAAFSPASRGLIHHGQSSAKKRPRTPTQPFSTPFARAPPQLLAIALHTAQPTGWSRNMHAALNFCLMPPTHGVARVVTAQQCPLSTFASSPLPRERHRTPTSDFADMETAPAADATSVHEGPSATTSGSEDHAGGSGRHDGATRTRCWVWPGGGQHSTRPGQRTRRRERHGAVPQHRRERGGAATYRASLAKRANGATRPAAATCAARPGRGSGYKYGRSRGAMPPLTCAQSGSAAGR
jgi:hypothetical protein